MGSTLSVHSILRVLALLLSRLLLKLLLLFLDFLLEVLVMVVGCERLLDVLLVEQDHILLNHFTVLVLPLPIRILRVIVIDCWVNLERSLDPLVEQVVPREIAQPRVVFYILRAVESESVQRLSLNKSIDEVSSLDRPAVRDICSFDLDLLSEDVVSDLSSVSALVRSSAEHALVADDSHGEVVDCDSVRLLAHDFRSHVAWGSTRIFGVVRVPHACNSQVSDFEVRVAVEHQVFRLDVSVEDTLLV